MHRRFLGFCLFVFVVVVFITTEHKQILRTNRRIIFQQLNSSVQLILFNLQWFFWLLCPHPTSLVLLETFRFSCLL